MLRRPRSKTMALGSAPILAALAAGLAMTPTASATAGRTPPIAAASVPAASRSLTAAVVPAGSPSLTAAAAAIPTAAAAAVPTGAAAAIPTAAAAAPIAAAGATASSASLLFTGNFDSGLAPWLAKGPTGLGGGGVQCANYGWPNKAPRLRGDLAFDTSNPGQGTTSGKFTLPANTNPIYTLEQCELITSQAPLALNVDGYYGLMVYVPQGWTVPSKTFPGIEISEYYFQAIYGGPIRFNLNPDHVTLSLQTGACNAPGKAGCQWHTNADNYNSRQNLPREYVIPPGGFVQGQWNEMVMHVHWAADSTGSVETWYKVKGDPTWTPSASLSGYPTVQWPYGGSPGGNQFTIAQAYGGSLTAPVSLWLDNEVEGTSLAAVQAAMP